MESKRENEVWDEVDAIEVPLMADVQKGPGYFADRLFTCRHAQDRVTTLEGEVQRAKSSLLMRLADIAEDHAQGAKVRRRLDALNRLLEAIKTKQGTLGRTAKDIQTLAVLTNQEQRLMHYPEAKEADYYRPGKGPELDGMKALSDSCRIRRPREPK